VNPRVVAKATLLAKGFLRVDQGSGGSRKPDPRSSTSVRPPVEPVAGLMLVSVGVAIFLLANEKAPAPPVMGNAGA
jgi:hypothetical protein